MPASCAWCAAAPRKVQEPSIRFQDEVPLPFIRRVFATIADTPRHTYQVLTKRSQRLAAVAAELPWPENLWMGVSVDGPKVLSRIDDLRRVPAAVRFISAEPLLGPLGEPDLSGLHWVIVGGESGPGARPMEEAWAVQLRDLCVRQGVPFFFKQWGGVNKRIRGRLLQGQRWDEMPGHKIASDRIVFSSESNSVESWDHSHRSKPAARRAAGEAGSSSMPSAGSA